MKSHIQFNRGFTLIELLVVIAIIGILASVVLASLNSARDKGNDASVKSNLTSVRSQAELIYHDNPIATGYGNICADTKVRQIIDAAKTAAGISAATGYDAVGSGTTATCNDTAVGYAVQVPLRTSSYFCVDSTGKATTTAANNLNPGTDIACN